MKTLTQVIAEHRIASIAGLRSHPIGCLCQWRGTFDDHAAHVAAAYRAARTITTTDALSELPTCSLVRDKTADVWLRYPNGWDNLSEDGTAGSYDDSALKVPVHVLYLPGDEA